MDNIIKILQTLQEAEQYIILKLQNGKYKESAFLFDDIDLCVKTVSNYLTNIKSININKFDCGDASVFDDAQRLEEFVIRLDEWQKDIMAALQPAENTQMQKNNSVDSRFFELIKDVENVAYDKLLYGMKKRFKQCDPICQKGLEDYFTRYPLWGSLCVKNNNFDTIEQKAASLHDHLQDYIWLYNRLMDYRSKAVLAATLRNWFYYDFSMLGSVKELCFPEYFDLDLMPTMKNEVLVDLGAFTGDSTIDFIVAYGVSGYKKIYCYEITPSSFDIMQKNLSAFPNIVCRQKGVSDGKGVMYISFVSDNDNSSNVLANSGEIAIDTVSIDEDITEPVTIIKMDIEGAEQSALRGCAKHIQNDHPKLLISVYHNNEDIWKIPRMIDEICDGYQFYLRYHGDDLVATETTLIAIYGKSA